LKSTLRPDGLAPEDPKKPRTIRRVRIRDVECYPLAYVSQQTGLPETQIDNLVKQTQAGKQLTAEHGWVMMGAKTKVYFTEDGMDHLKRFLRRHRKVNWNNPPEAARKAPLFSETQRDQMGKWLENLGRGRSQFGECALLQARILPEDDEIRRRAELIYADRVYIDGANPGYRHRSEESKSIPGFYPRRVR